MIRRLHDALSARKQRWLRFLIGGGINTSFTYGIYLFLGIFVGYQKSFFLAYMLGVVFSYWFNSVVVFRAALSWKTFFSYPLVYVVQYGFSAVLSLPLGLVRRSRSQPTGGPGGQGPPAPAPSPLHDLIRHPCYLAALPSVCRRP